MSIRNWRISRRLVALPAAVLAIASLAAIPASSPADPSLGTLGSQLSQQTARQQQLQSSLGSLDNLISSLSSQISLVRSREAQVQAELDYDRAQLAKTQAALVRERARLARLRRRLAWARALLGRQLVSHYESDSPDLVTVVLEARGFNDLLERINFLRYAERQQQQTIAVTTSAKQQADAAAAHLGKLEQTDRTLTNDAALRIRALAGMDSLLAGRESSLEQAQAVQRAALGASQTKASQLQSEITRIQAQQAAAARAAAQQAAAQQSSSQSAPSSGPALGPSGGWAIPYSIVLCESGGQNLPPNSAGASGYYQIIPSTWTGFGGAGPAAYLASKAEQDAVATRIWNGGAGASNWVCAGIVGIH